MPGSIVAQIANPQGGDIETVRIEHPSGFLETRCELGPRGADGLPVIASASIVATARALFTGMALVRASAPPHLRALADVAANTAKENT